MTATCGNCGLVYTTKPSISRQNAGGNAFTNQGNDCIRCGHGQDQIA